MLSGSSEEIESLSRELKVSPLVARLLVQRGLADPETARSFLNPRLEDLHNPFRMKDMDRTVARIFQAIQSREKILIYGDYDVDGITATVVLKRALEMLGARVDFYLPKRLEEGYGVKIEVLQKARQEGCHLVVTADTGVRAFEASQAARELGLDLIVTDHHLPDTSLPSAYALLNPRRPDCGYPDKDLAAVGVVFKLVQALFREARKDHVTSHFLKLVAIGTIGDIVPLTGENRLFVKFGLEGLSEPRNLGLRALLKGAGVSGEVSLSDVGFKLAPRINAVTRMGGGREIVDLFSAADLAIAEAIVQSMNQKNVQRQRQEQEILAEIDERFQQDPRARQKNFLVVAGQNWHRGVIGIVASRLVEKHYRPVLVLSIGDSYCQGSGRSIPALHLLTALDSCRDLLVQFGGHAQAVGCTVEPSKIPELERRLEEYAQQTLSFDEYTPSLRIESLLPIESVSLPLYHELQQLAPFGAGNPLPVFASHKVGVANGPWVLKDEHLKFQVQANGCRVDAIWWKNGTMVDTIRPGSRLDVAYTVTRDIYQGEEKLLLTVRDIRQA